MLKIVCMHTYIHAYTAGGRCDSMVIASRDEQGPCDPPFPRWRKDVLTDLNGTGVTDVNPTGVTAVNVTGVRVFLRAAHKTCRASLVHSPSLRALAREHTHAHAHKHSHTHACTPGPEQVAVDAMTRPEALDYLGVESTDELMGTRPSDAF